MEATQIEFWRTLCEHEPFTGKNCHQEIVERSDENERNEAKINLNWLGSILMLGSILKNGFGLCLRSLPTKKFPSRKYIFDKQILILPTKISNKNLPKNAKSHPGLALPQS